MTGVDKLHLQGIQGAGVNIGIIDTGVDFTHPALGGCFGPGCKIVGGVDLVGDAFNGTNNPVQGKVQTMYGSLFTIQAGNLLTSAMVMVHMLVGLSRQTPGTRVHLNHL